MDITDRLIRRTEPTTPSQTEQISSEENLRVPDRVAKAPYPMDPENLQWAYEQADWRGASLTLPTGWFKRFGS